MGWFLLPDQVTPAPHRTILNRDSRRVWFACDCGTTGPAYRDDDYGRSRARYAAIWHHNLRNDKEQDDD